MGMFIEDCCELDSEGVVSRNSFFMAWSRWCHQRGEDAGTIKVLKRRFRNKMLELNVHEHRVKEGQQFLQGYRGINLREDESWM